MSQQSRLESLVRRHEAVEAEVAAKLKSPAVEDRELSTLKKLKLRLKDEMQALQTRH